MAPRAKGKGGRVKPLRSLRTSTSTTPNDSLTNSSTNTPSLSRVQSSFDFSNSLNLNSILDELRVPDLEIFGGGLDQFPSSYPGFGNGLERFQSSYSYSSSMHQLPTVPPPNSNRLITFPTLGKSDNDPTLSLPALDGVTDSFGLSEDFHDLPLFADQPTDSSLPPDPASGLPQQSPYDPPQQPAPDNAFPDQTPSHHRTMSQGTQSQTNDTGGGGTGRKKLSPEEMQQNHRESEHRRRNRVMSKWTELAEDVIPDFKGNPNSEKDVVEQMLRHARTQMTKKEELFAKYVELVGEEEAERRLGQIQPPNRRASPELVEDAGRLVLKQAPTDN